MDDLSLFDKIEKEDNKEKTVKKNKGRKSSTKPIYYDILDDDPELVRIIKEEINNAQITNQNVYDTFGRDEGWNMIYSLRKSQMSWERFKKWLEVMGKEVSLDITEVNKK